MKSQIAINMKLVFAFAVMLVVTTASLLDAECYYNCPRYAAPVCGVNGVTYANRCFLSCQRQQLAYVGPCRGASVPRGLPYPLTNPPPYNGLGNGYDNGWYWPGTGPQVMG